MRLRACLPAVLCALLLTLSAQPLSAQTATTAHKPKLGQKGKDVRWIPSAPDMVETMLDLARVTPQDYVVDLGSGDGRNVIGAAKRGAHALGVEYDADLVELSRRNAAKAGVADKATFVKGDMYQADISQVTVLALFLTPYNLIKLMPRFLELKAGTRIVSNTYEIGGGWQPDKSKRVEPCERWCIAHLYVVPAQVEGTWRLREGELTLEQEFQRLTGTYRIKGVTLPVENGFVRGKEIRFTVAAAAYSGRVEAGSIDGTVVDGGIASTWSAKRAGD
jgi:SAM-dependent methyltransferase